MGEGFFIACLQKKGGQVLIKKPKKKRKGKQQQANFFKKIDKKLLPELTKWLTDMEHYDLVTHADSIYALPKSLAGDMELVSSALWIKKCRCSSWYFQTSEVCASSSLGFIYYFF